MKKIVIIGAGVSGLTAGIYAKKAGFDVEIYEKHFMAGGECAGWDREGYHIDGCIHWLTGTKNDGGAFNTMWRETGALGDDVEIVKHDSFGAFEACGSRIDMSRDLSEFKSQLLSLSPEDREEIEILCEFLEQFSGVDAPKNAVDLMSLRELFGLLKTSGRLFKLMKKLKMSTREYSQRFKNPTIQALIRYWLPPNDDMSVSSFIASYGSFINGYADVPRGGSVKMVERMRDKFLSLGGELFLSTPVETMEVNVKDKKAQIVLKDGCKVDADYIIASCDVHITFKLLGKKYNEKKFELRDNNANDYPLMNSVLHSFAVDYDMKNLPQSFTFLADERVEIYDEKIGGLSYKCYNHEPSFAPKDKSIMQVNIFAGSYDYWKNLKELGIDEYKQAKQAGGEIIIKALEDKLPILKGKLRLIDVATPLTFERYCGAYKGSWMSWGKTHKSKTLMHNGRVKGIKNLFLAGQWLMPPGGLPLAISGKWAVQKIAKKEKLDWRKI